MSEKERSNLDVLLNAHVSKVMIKKHIARGVEYIKNGRKKTVKATKEVREPSKHCKCLPIHSLW